MPTLHRRRVLITAGSLALIAPLMLSGCSLVHLPGIPKLPGQSSTSGGVSIPGLGSVGTGKLPKDFPSDVPVIKGDIVEGMSLGGGSQKVWNVSVKVSGVDAFDTITSELTGAGFTEPDGVGAKDTNGATGAFQGSKYDIAVVVVKSDDKTGWVANYTVTAASDDNN
jgi:hypothetical protein